MIKQEIKEKDETCLCGINGCEKCCYHDGLDGHFCVKCCGHMDLDGAICPDCGEDFVEDQN